MIDGVGVEVGAVVVDGVGVGVTHTQVSPPPRAVVRVAATSHPSEHMQSMDVLFTNEGMGV